MTKVENSIPVRVPLSQDPLLDRLTVVAVPAPKLSALLRESCVNSRLSPTNSPSPLYLKIEAARELHFGLVENPNHVGDQENEQYGAEPDAPSSTVTPPAMAVVSTSKPKNQQQNNN